MAIGRLKQISHRQLIWLTFRSMNVAIASKSCRAKTLWKVYLRERDGCFFFIFFLLLYISYRGWIVTKKQKKRIQSIERHWKNEMQDIDLLAAIKKRHLWPLKDWRELKRDQFELFTQLSSWFGGELLTGGPMFIIQTSHQWISW